MTSGAARGRRHLCLCRRDASMWLVEVTTPDAFVRLAFVPIPFPQDGRPGPPPGPGVAVVPCRMHIPYRLLCWAWRGTLRSCDILCGMARSYPCMMTCGSPSRSCASHTPPFPYYYYFFSSCLSYNQLSMPQVHLDDVRVYSTLTRQRCAYIPSQPRAQGPKPHGGTHDRLN